MPAPHEKLAESLAELEKLLAGGKRVFRSDEMTRLHRERLLRTGFLQQVVRGWLIASSPGTAAVGDDGRSPQPVLMGKRTNVEDGEVRGVPEPRRPEPGDDPVRQRVTVYVGTRSHRPAFGLSARFTRPYRGGWRGQQTGPQGARRHED